MHDLKGEGSNTFNVNSAGQIYLKSTNVGGNDGLILESQQGGIKLDSESSLTLKSNGSLIDIDGLPSDIKIGKSTHNQYKLVVFNQIQQQFNHKKFI